MATNFLYATGTNGYIVTPFAFSAGTDLSGLGSGAGVLLSGGTSGVFTQTNTGHAILGGIWFKSAGAFTPIVGQCLNGWFLPSDQTNYETQIGTPSTTVPAFARPPDFIIPLQGAAYANGNLSWAAGRNVKLPAEDFKVYIQNTGTTALSANNHSILCGPIAVQY